MGIGVPLCAESDACGLVCYYRMPDGSDGPVALSGFVVSHGGPEGCVAILVHVYEKWKGETALTRAIYPPGYLVLAQLQSLDMPAKRWHLRCPTISFLFLFFNNLFFSRWNDEAVSWCVAFSAWNWAKF